MDHSCVACDRNFGSKSALKQHQKNSPVHKKNFHCQTCNSTFGSKKALEQHQQDSPVHNKAFHCQTCNSLFGSKKALGSHRKNCQLHQESSENALDASSGLRRDSATSSNTRAGNPTLGIAEIARENVSKPTQETKEFFMFPTLHQSVAEAVFPEISSTWFLENENDDDCNDEYGTYIMGRFVCNNTACQNQIWSSKKVFVEIRGYDGNGYSAVVYNQRCRSCDKLGTFTLDEASYIDRVAYRLKKWAGVGVAPPYYGLPKGPEHEWRYCEGCKRGKCQRGNGSGIY